MSSEIHLENDNVNLTFRDRFTKYGGHFLYKNSIDNLFKMVYNQRYDIFTLLYYHNILMI